jgi:hypothetical protein
MTATHMTTLMCSVVAVVQVPVSGDCVAVAGALFYNGINDGRTRCSADDVIDDDDGVGER